MRTAADKVDVASDRRRRENVPRHILCSDLRANHKKVLVNQHCGGKELYC